MNRISLPITDQRSYQLKCGCTKTVTRHDAFRVTEIIPLDCCAKHGAGNSPNEQDATPLPDKQQKRLRDGMSMKLRFDILKRDSHTCRYCGRSAPEVALEVDHIIPVSRGGPSTPDNLVAACFECNRGKRDRQ